MMASRLDRIVPPFEGYCCKAFHKDNDGLKTEGTLYESNKKNPVKKQHEKALEAIQFQISFCLPTTRQLSSTTHIRVFATDQDLCRLYTFSVLTPECCVPTENSLIKKSLCHKLHVLPHGPKKYKLKTVSPTLSRLWLTRDPLTFQEKVVKILPKKDLHGSSNGESLFRILCEKLLRITPKHRGLMHITDVIETPLNFYLFGEKLQGGELFDFLLRESAVPEDLCKYILRQILQAVEFLHHHHLLHRDIKPENLMLRSPRLKNCKKNFTPLSCLDCSRSMTSQQFVSYYELAIIDFDTCRITDLPHLDEDHVSHGRRRLVGTYGYLAPEVLEGYSYSTGSDLWSVGVILYILMTGVPPTPMELMVDAKTTLHVLQETEKKKIDFHLEPFESFPLACDLCKKLLEFDPKRRLSSASEALKHPWLYSFNGHGTTGQ